MNDILQNTNNLEHAGNVLYDNIKKCYNKKGASIDKYEWSFLSPIYSSE